MNWFFIPNPPGGIQSPAFEGSWPGTFTTSVQDTDITINLTTFVSITAMDATHAITTYVNDLGGSSRLMFARALEITGTVVAKGDNIVIQSGSFAGIFAGTATMTASRFVTAMDNSTDRFFVGDLAFPAITDAHGSVQGATSFTRVHTINANFLALSMVSATTGINTRLFSLTGTTTAAVGAQLVNLGALNSDRGAHSNGTYFSVVGGGIFFGALEPRFTSYYFDGSTIVNIADNLTISSNNGDGIAIHNLDNDLCAIAFRLDGNTTTQFISLYQSTPTGVNLIKTIEFLYDDLIVNLFSEGNVLYALTAPNGGTGSTTSLGISSFNVSPTNITFAAKFTIATSINQISNLLQAESIKIDKLSTNKWIFEYVSQLDSFLNYHIITA